MIYRGRLINAMPRIVTPQSSPNHDLDAGQAALRRNLILFVPDSAAFDRTVRGL